MAAFVAYNMFINLIRQDKQTLNIFGTIILDYILFF